MSISIKSEKKDKQIAAYLKTNANLVETTKLLVSGSINQGSSIVNFVGNIDNITGTIGGC